MPVNNDSKILFGTAWHAIEAHIEDSSVRRGPQAPFLLA